jgi:hypothetical protein
VFDVVLDSWFWAIRFMASTIDEAMSSGSVSNAREASRDSALRRNAWAGAIAARQDPEEKTFVA